MRVERPLLNALRNPSRVIAVALALAIVVGTALLALPVASADGQRAGWVTALFTATSAVCVTGLVVVDTATYWSWFGELVILLLIQAGGLGIMTLATLVVMLLSRRVGLRVRSVVQTETKAVTAADIRRVVRRVVLFSLSVEAVVAALLTLRFALGHGQALPQALYSGVFHSVSAFNNAGFGLHPDSLVRYVEDPWVSLTIAGAVIVGGLGFPVWFELARTWRRPRQWSVLTRITVYTTAVLLVTGTVFMVVAENSNPDTLGGVDREHRLVAAFVAAVMPRTAGFNNLDIAALRPETLFMTDIFMFIGGGSAGTAGGVKVTTFGLLAYVIWAETRGERDVHVGTRRVPTANQRQALTVALLSVGIVVLATLTMSALTTQGFDVILFETVSAFATVGLSTGITASLPVPAQLVLVALMFIGRIGPLTVASAMALRERPRLYQLPEERTIVG
ncbi:potassium uptake protein, TrkH family [Auraticoccus monumenti]|uniref:Potassium uptake protein, TrkH family n=1 Tax=Auraticoccus monumenti TaxID=675864 RepID=A0A1G6U134_9ACTN|nr:potassium uptake protein, TrkH family [Auraticoccus monumenti]